MDKGSVGSFVGHEIPKTKAKACIYQSSEYSNEDEDNSPNILSNEKLHFQFIFNLFESKTFNAFK